MPQSKKKPTKKKKAARSSRAWAKPIKDIKDLALMSPEDADELLSAIREMRELEHRAAMARIEHQAAMERVKRKRAPKRA